jgi:hypothetical protein
METIGSKKLDAATALDLNSLDLHAANQTRREGTRCLVGVGRVSQREHHHSASPMSTERRREPLLGAGKREQS